MALGRIACLVLASASLAAPVAAPVAAQTAPRDPGATTEGRQGRHGDWEAHRQERDRQRAADVALLLRLKPDQQAAYQTWEASMRPPEGEGRRRGREDEAAEAATTPQSLDRMQAGITEHEQDMRAHLDATRRFYALLSPEQQVLFDALMRLRRGGGEGGRGHGPGGPPTLRGEGEGMAGGKGPPPPSPGM